MKAALLACCPRTGLAGECWCSACVRQSTVACCCLLAVTAGPQALSNLHRRSRSLVSFQVYIRIQVTE